MKKKVLIDTLFLLLFTIVLCPQAFGAGAAEASGSSARGRYLASEGLIIPSMDVHIHSYIASIDYRYPIPDKDPVGLTIYSGNRQLSTAGQEEIIQIGIQAGKIDFDELPPMNLAFVIDKSGSMSASQKMDWVKEAFAIFITQVRPIDFVSLVTFDQTAQVVYNSTQMATIEKRLQFQSAVQRITPSGGTNLAGGLELGYQQVMANYRKDYTNRVLFLTDGVGESKGILEMAERFKDLGINVSTIGVGTDFDLKLMTDLAHRGGGSSRFISSREEMAEIFGSELDRMVVPAVKNLSLQLELPEGYTVLETWGYDHKISENKVLFSQPTLHHRDYETILVRIKVPSGIPRGFREIARVTLSYSDFDGKETISDPYVLKAEFVDTVAPVSGFSDGMVMKSGTMLHFAQSLVTIGELYYSCDNELSKINSIRDELWKNSQETAYEEITSPELVNLETSVSNKLQRALDITIAMKKELVNAKLRLDNEGFDEEIMILDSYLKIFSDELKLESEKVEIIRSDTELSPTVADRSLQDHITNLFQEIILSMSGKGEGTIAISGFTDRSGKGCSLIEMLNEMAVLTLQRFDTLRVVERARLDLLIEEQKLQLSGLVDTDTALEIGRLLGANYMLTGTVIEMSNSVVIFSRILNVETGEVESVAQIIVPKSVEVLSLLS